jgi:hypothetical protein
MVLILLKRLIVYIQHWVLQEGVYKVQKLESLSKTTKYEDEGILDNFCRMYIILRILSWTSLVLAQRIFPCVAVYEY